MIGDLRLLVLLLLTSAASGALFTRPNSLQLATSEDPQRIYLLAYSFTSVAAENTSVSLDGIYQISNDTVNAMAGPQGPVLPALGRYLYADSMPSSFHDHLSLPPSSH